MKKSQEFEMTPVALAAFRMQALIDLMAALGDKYDVATHNFRHGTQLLDPKGYARSLRASLDKSHPLANERVVMPLVERYAAEQNELRRREICKFMERVDIDRGTAEVAKLAAHLRDAPEADPLDVAAIRSMLWQIKRKLFGHYSVEYPLLLVLVGGQGYGKNVTYEKISKPLKDLCGGGIQLKQR